MRAFLGITLILHGLAHAGTGMWAAGPTWLITLLWWSATVTYVAAGLGVLGFLPFRLRSAELAFAALIPSSLLLGTFAGLYVLPGMALDIALIFAVVRLNDRTTLVMAKPARRWGRRAHAVAALFLVYVSVAILGRPWAMRFGTTGADRAAELFGDSLNPAAGYVVDNAIRIDAPADSVWPWLAQIGQDRGGFYSYDWLERAVGVRIRNADSIVLAWQDRKVGDFVRATQPTYLGGAFADDLGWRITAIDPGRAIVLDKWGAFIVRPIDDRTSQLYIRQRNPGTPSFVGNLFAPVGLLVLEPAHFIMQRGMLRGVKRRAEGIRPES
jgi:hypothetical protein